MQRSEAPDGTEFYCVIEYPSTIWRSQKLVSGANGKFWRDEDGVWHLWGRYWTPVFLSEVEAKSEEGTRNFQSYMKANEKALLWRRVAKNVGDHISKLWELK